MPNLKIQKAERAFAAGQLEEAAALAQGILAKTPKLAAAHRILGLVRAQQGRWQEASDSLKTASKAKASAEVLLLGGISFMQLGEPQKARAFFEQLTQSHPSQANGFYNLGVCLTALDKIQEAKLAYQREIQIAGSQALGFANLGALFRAQGQIEQAMTVWKQGKERSSNAHVCELNLAQAHLENEQYEQAILGFKRYLQIEPTRADVEVNLAIAHFRLGKLPQSEKILRRILSHNPRNPQALRELGQLLLASKRRKEAIEYLERATEVLPDEDTYVALALALRESGDFKATEAILQEAIERHPHSVQLCVEQQLWLPRFFETDEDVEDHHQRFARGIETLEMMAEDPKEAGPELLRTLDSRTNFSLPYLGREDRLLLERYGRIHTALARKFAPLPLPKPPKRERIRVGWVSQYFRAHTVAKLLKGYLRLDPNQFESWAVHLGEGMDPTSKDIEQRVDRFIHLPFSVETISQKLLSYEFDILIYSDVGMGAKTEALSARRLAPIQATTFCHPVTSGHPEIDYYISVEGWEPEHGDHYYSERVLKLPRPGVYFEPIESASTKTRTDFGLPEEGLLFLSPQSLFKYLPWSADVYARVLEGCPASNMAFLVGETQSALATQFAARLSKACQSRSIDPGRIFYLPQQSQDDFGRLHQLSDVLLDSLPFSSFTSLLEVWGQTPIPAVARLGRFARERPAAATLDLIGLPELAAASVDDYVEAAIKLGSDEGFRTRCRAVIQNEAPALFLDQRPREALRGHLLRLAGKARGSDQTFDSSPCADSASLG